jgi:HTH-type transcriptional regulator / antitoxin HigA
MQQNTMAMNPTLKYTVIKTREQYDEYCNTLESLVFGTNQDQQAQAEMELLTLLIETWDAEYAGKEERDAVSLVKSLMDVNQMKNKDLAAVLEVSPSLISDILNRRKGFSKDIIWKLSQHFKISQDLLNRPRKVGLQAA